MKEDKVTLGDCYHTGLAYALGYDANGEVELCGKVFTNLNTGGDSAMKALSEHRQQFNPHRDIKRFIVALKPVKIITGLEDNEDDEICRECGEGYCDCCCDDEYDDEYCGNCNSHNCCCDDDDDYDEDGYCNQCMEICTDCTCNNKNEADITPLNAFARARWLKSQEKL